MRAATSILGGKYTFVRPLESGGMGDVYEAVQNDLGRPVAIKLLRADVVGDPAAFLRFRREAEAAASLGHPNIVQILEFRDDVEQPMLVMEKLEGRSLRDLLSTSGPLAPERAVFIALQILSALAAAHDAQIVHRDVKPGNVFVLKTLAVRDFVKVLDFGIAKLLEPGAGAPALTDLGQVLGTLAYMAPEQARGMAVDARADLFAVGAILFEALSAQRPRTLGPAALLDAGTIPCRKLRECAPQIAAPLAAAVDRALAHDRNERFSDARAMAHALAPFGPGGMLDLERTGVTVAEHAAPAAEQGAPIAEQAPPTVDDGQAPTQLSPADQPSRPSHAGPPAAAAQPVRLAPLARPVRLPPHAQPGPLAPPAPFAPPGPVRASYPGSGAPPRLVPPPGSSGTPWYYFLPLFAFAFVLMVVGAFVLLVMNARDRDNDFMTAATPSRCVAPSTCSGSTTVSGEAYAYCAGGTRPHPRVGDVVLVGNGRSSEPFRLVQDRGALGFDVTSPSGVSRTVEVAKVHGSYCAP